MARPKDYKHQHTSTLHGFVEEVRGGVAEGRRGGRDHKCGLVLPVHMLSSHCVPPSILKWSAFLCRMLLTAYALNPQWLLILPLLTTYCHSSTLHANKFNLSQSHLRFLSIIGGQPRRASVTHRLAQL